MRKIAIKKVLAVSIAASVASSAFAAPDGDAAAVKLIQQRQAEAWNTHDIKAYISLFTANAHVVNVLGWNWTSRTELEQKLGRAFQSIFANSRMTIESVDVDFLKPDIAVAQVRWSMTGALSPTGAGSQIPQQGIQTQVLIRDGGRWKITHFQNTNSTPERPFPAAH